MNRLARASRYESGGTKLRFQVIDNDQNCGQHCRQLGIKVREMPSAEEIQERYAQAKLRSEKTNRLYSCARWAGRHSHDRNRVRFFSCQRDIFNHVSIVCSGVSIHIRSWLDQLEEGWGRIQSYRRKHSWAILLKQQRLHQRPKMAICPPISQSSNSRPSVVTRYRPKAVNRIWPSNQKWTPTSG